MTKARYILRLQAFHRIPPPLNSKVLFFFLVTSVAFKLTIFVDLLVFEKLALYAHHLERKALRVNITESNNTSSANTSNTPGKAKSQK